MSGITIVGGGIAGLVAAITCAEAEAEVTPARGARRPRRPRPQHRRPLQGEPRPARPLQGRPVLPLAPRSRPDARHPRGAAGADPLPLAGRAPAHAAARHRSGGAAAARPRGSRRPRLPQLGDRPHRRADRPDPLRRRRRLHLPPRPRRALGRVHLGPHRARPPQRAAAGALRDRRLERAWSRRSRTAPAGSASRIETDHCVTALPEPPVIVATELRQARELLGDDSLEWPSGHDGLPRPRRRAPARRPLRRLRPRRGRAGSSATAPPTRLAPPGEELIQAQMPIRPDESADQACLRLERLIDLALPDWRERETWRRRTVMDGRSGALDLPGTTWRDRPAVDRGDGVFVAGDMMASPGLLSEVAWGSGVEAATLRGRGARPRAARRCAPPRRARSSRAARRGGSSRARGRPPRRPASRSGGPAGRSTPASRRVAMSLKASSSSRASIRAPRSFGRCSRIALSRTSSSEPWRRSRSAAVFAPTPLAPGMPSEGSPRRAMKSGTWSGSIP